MLSACGGNLHPPRASGGGTSSVFSLSTEQQQRPILKHLQYHSNCTVIYILERRTDKTLTKLIIYNGDFARTAQNFEEKFIVFFHFFSRCLLFCRRNIFRTCDASNYYCFTNSLQRWENKKTFDFSFCKSCANFIAKCLKVVGQAIL